METSLGWLPTTLGVSEPPDNQASFFPFFCRNDKKSTYWNPNPKQAILSP